MRLPRGTFNFCKIAIFTSLVWVVIDILVLYHFTGCTDESCLHKEIPKREILQHGLGAGLKFSGGVVRQQDLENPVPVDVQDVGENPADQNVIKAEIDHQNRLAADDKLRNGGIDPDAEDIIENTRKKNEQQSQKKNFATIIGELEIPTMTPVGYVAHPGDGGDAVVLTEEEKALDKDTFSVNYFSMVVSEKLSVHRRLPDYRLDSCKKKVYPRDLPNTSVIIIFHNEHNTTLLRTVHSVIDRTPRKLLHEIILVDDYSDKPHLKAPLDAYVAKLPVPTRVLHLPDRTGLIRARLAGADVATGAVLLFLDSHCECTRGWLEPLVSEIHKNKTTAVVPIIDAINDENFKFGFNGEYYQMGGFNWNIEFNWYTIPKRIQDLVNGDWSVPSPTPTMAGGLFAISREYFVEIGRYDNEMDIWGAENIEISFRIWQCGGRILSVPCSHVGHIFRRNSPYKWPKREKIGRNVVGFNTRRVVEVWMDEYKEFYYFANPNARRNFYGDITERQELRERLQCKSFRWYLENVWPESSMFAPVFFLGEIRNIGTGTCLDTMGHKVGLEVRAMTCHGSGGNQVWAYSKKNEIRNDDKCLDVSKIEGPATTYSCHGLGGHQLWLYDEQKKTLLHQVTNQCMGCNPNDVTKLRMGPCDGSNLQQWEMTNAGILNGLINH